MSLSRAGRWFASLVLAASLMLALSVGASAHGQRTFSFFGPAPCNHYQAFAAEAHQAQADVVALYGDQSNTALRNTVHAELTHLYNCGQIGILRAGIANNESPAVLAFFDHLVDVWF